MIFQALIRRRQYLLTLVTIILSILFSLPVVAGFSPTVFKSNPPSLVTESIVAKQSLTIAQGQHSVSFWQQLNLTDEQQQQIKIIHSRYRQEISQKKDNLAKLQRQLSDMMVGTAPIELLRAKNQQLSDLQQKISTLRFECMLATREILTPLQREKFRELVNSQLSDD